MNLRAAPAAPTTERASGRPLDPAISDRIRDATLDVLDEDGYERLSMEAVAHRAGVHRPAVYRRWPNKLELVVAALSSTGPEPVDPDTGDIRSDLVAIVADVVKSMHQNPRMRVGLGMLVGASTDDELAAVVNERVVEPRRAIARRVVARGIEHGALDPETDPDLTIDMLIGTAISRVMVRRRTITRAQIEQLVGVVLGCVEKR